MNLDAIITQLKQYAPVFGGNVAGIADLDASTLDSVWLPAPAAYVRPLQDEPGPNLNMNSLQQLVMQHVGVVVMFDSSADRRGQSVTYLFEEVRRQLWGALLNWQIDRVKANRALEYAGGQPLVHEDRARRFYEWSFMLEITINASDGFQISGDPITEMVATFVEQPPDSTVLGVADIVIQQP